MRFKTFLIFIFTTSLIVFSQNDYQPGFVVSNTNDTIHGLIEYGFTQSANFNNCKFKLNEPDKPTVYSPGDIMGYMISDHKLFVSKKLPIGDSTKLVFAEILVEGAMNLYYYMHNLDPMYFIEKEDDEIYQLENKTVRKSLDNVEYERSSNMHIGVLHYALSDCNEINQQIDNTILNHKSLIKLTKDYHKYTCTTGEECVVYQKPKKVHWSFGFYAGYLNSHLKVLDSYPYRTRIPNSYLNQSFDIGVLAELSPLNKTNKFSFNFSLGFSSLHYTEDPTDGTEIENPNQRYVDVTYIQSSNAIKYSWPFKVLKPYLHAGIKIGMSKSKDYDLYGYYDRWGVWTPINEIVVTPISPFFYGPLVGGGLDIFLGSRMVFFIDFTYSFEFATYNNVSNLQLKTGLRF